MFHLNVPYTFIHWILESLLVNILNQESEMSFQYLNGTICILLLKLCCCVKLIIFFSATAHEKIIKIK